MKIFEPYIVFLPPIDAFDIMHNMLSNYFLYLVSWLNHRYMRFPVTVYVFLYVNFLEHSLSSVFILIGTFGLIFFHKFIFDISNIISPIHNVWKDYVIYWRHTELLHFPISPFKNKHF